MYDLHYGRDESDLVSSAFDFGSTDMDPLGSISGYNFGSWNSEFGFDSFIQQKDTKDDDYDDEFPSFGEGTTVDSRLSQLNNRIDHNNPSEEATITPEDQREKNKRKKQKLKEPKKRGPTKLIVPKFTPTPQPINEHQKYYQNIISMFHAGNEREWFNRMWEPAYRTQNNTQQTTKNGEDKQQTPPMVTGSSQSSPAGKKRDRKSKPKVVLDPQVPDKQASSYNQTQLQQGNTMMMFPMNSGGMLTPILMGPHYNLLSIPNINGTFAPHQMSTHFNQNQIPFYPMYNPLQTTKNTTTATTTTTTAGSTKEPNSVDSCVSRDGLNPHTKENIDVASTTTINASPIVRTQGENLTEKSNVQDNIPPSTSDQNTIKNVEEGKIELERGDKKTIQQQPPLPPVLINTSDVVEEEEEPTVTPLVYIPTLSTSNELESIIRQIYQQKQIDTELRDVVTPVDNLLDFYFQVASIVLENRRVSNIDAEDLLQETQFLFEPDIQFGMIEILKEALLYVKTRAKPKKPYHRRHKRHSK